VSKRDKGRLPPFVPLHVATIDCPAWIAMSHGAKWLFIGLKRKSNNGPRAYLSYRDAQKHCRAGFGKVREWFAELEHYGFIRLHSHGCLGSDGQGKSPHWTLTEKGQTSKVNPQGVFELRRMISLNGMEYHSTRSPIGPRRRLRAGTISKNRIPLLTSVAPRYSRQIHPRYSRQ
jgi:hypothetical protein